MLPPLPPLSPSSTSCRRRRNLRCGRRLGRYYFGGRVFALPRRDDITAICGCFWQHVWRQPLSVSSGATAASHQGGCPTYGDARRRPLIGDGIVAAAAAAVVVQMGSFRLSPIQDDEINSENLIFGLKNKKTAIFDVSIFLNFLTTIWNDYF